MKYLLTVLIISALSCNKDNDEPINRYDPPPALTSIQSAPETVNGVTRPKFTVTLTVPDTTNTQLFILFHKNSNAPCTIIKPKSGTYTITDTYNPYPLTGDKKLYSSGFVMSDNSTIYSVGYTVN